MTTRAHRAAGDGRSPPLRRGLLALLLLCALPIATVADQPVEAWWLTATFPADRTSYRGLDVASIDPQWSKIGVLSYETLPADTRDDLSSIHDGKFAFEMEGDLSHKGTVDHVVTGVFGTQGGTSGRFVLVLRKQPGGEWKKLFLHTERGQRGFGVLVPKGQQIY